MKIIPRTPTRGGWIALSLFSVLSPLAGCDDGSSGNGGFGGQSAASLCGNGVVDAVEACDDGNKVDGDGCSSTCRTEPGYTCADGSCHSTCGDGIKARDEACDDPKTPAYCSAECKVIGGCADGVLQANEACDPKLTTGCRADCKPRDGFRCGQESQLCEADTALAGSAAMDKLSAEQKTQFCEWLTTALGGVGAKITCGNTQYTILSVGNCTTALPFSEWPGCSFDDMVTWIGTGSGCAGFTDAPPCIQ